jgi:hypothetical protein
VTVEDLLGKPIEGATRREVNGVVAESVRAGAARITRVIYPSGYRWSQHLKPAVGTELCMHAHIGLLISGRMQGEYSDGCTFDFVAPAAVVVEPGHDAWTVGDESAIFVQVDFEDATAEHFGLPSEHRHEPDQASSESSAARSDAT